MDDNKYWLVVLFFAVVLFVLILIWNNGHADRINDLEDEVAAIKDSMDSFQTSIDNLSSTNTQHGQNLSSQAAQLDDLEGQVQQNTADDADVRARLGVAEADVDQNAQDIELNESGDADVRARMDTVEASIVGNSGDIQENAANDALLESRLGDLETELEENALNDASRGARLDSTEALLSNNIADDDLQDNYLESLESRVDTLENDVAEQVAVDAAHGDHLESIDADLSQIDVDIVEVQNSAQDNEDDINSILPPSFTSAASVNILQSGDTGVFYQVTLSSNSLVTAVELESERTDLLVEPTDDSNVWDVSSTVDGFVLGEDFSMRLTATNEHDMKSEAFNVEIVIKDVPTFSPNTADVTFDKGDTPGFTVILSAAEDTTTAGLNYSLTNFSGSGLDSTFYDFTVSDTQLVFTVIGDFTPNNLGDHSFEVLAENEFGGQDTLLVNVTVTG